MSALRRPARPEGYPRLDERRLARLRASGDRLEPIEFADGDPVARDALWPALDAKGIAQVDEQRRETSRPGIYAGGDLVTNAQGVIFAAASGTQAAAALNHDLTAELATSGALR